MSAVGLRATTAAARQLLGLDAEFTARELRDSYFEAAKACHPDSSDDQGTDDTFIRVTEAYECLRSGVSKNPIDTRSLYDTPGTPRTLAAAS